LIHKIIANDISASELNRFVAFCQAVSKTSLIHEMQLGRLNLDQSLSSQNQLDDFAIDCIGDLFARNESGELYLIKRVFESKIDIINASPQSVVIQLRKLICSRVHQSLISHFSRVDQGGWKIWRNLSLVTKRSPHIHEFKYLSNSYFYLNGKIEIKDAPQGLNPNGSILPDSILSDWLQESLKEHYGLPQAIQAVFKILKTRREYRQFLERGRLFYALKQHLNISYVDISEMETLNIGETGVEDLDSEKYHSTLNAGVNAFISEELLAKYIEKGKISPELSSRYAGILNMYFTDLIADGNVDKLQRYLALTSNEELMDAKWLLHRGRLEYMIKLGKSWLRDQIKSEKIPTSGEVRVYK